MRDEPATRDAVKVRSGSRVPIPFCLFLGAVLESPCHFVLAKRTSVSVAAVAAQKQQCFPLGPDSSVDIPVYPCQPVPPSPPLFPLPPFRPVLLLLHILSSMISLGFSPCAPVRLGRCPPCLATLVCDHLTPLPRFHPIMILPVSQSPLCRGRILS